MSLRSILLEASTKEKLAVEYLRNLIKGSEYENNVFIAGGAVRDEVLGLDAKDIDLVVSLPDGGIRFAEWITNEMGNYKEGSNPVVFERFGTAKFDLRGITYKGEDLSDIDIEAVMTRTEKYSEDSRKPEVDYGTLKQDVERRDFTVNSLLKDLSTGEILDLTGSGLKDINAGVVRTVLDPEYIFGEDPLRMLRAIRFAVKYDWDLPMFMIRAIKSSASKIQNISMERVRDELNKMIVLRKPDKAIRLLQITNLAEYTIPELQKIVRLKQNKHHKWDVNIHTLEVLKNVEPHIVNRLGALLHDIGKYATKEVIDGEVHFYKHEKVGADIARDIMKRLKYPNHIIDAVATAVENHMRLKQSGLQGEIITDKALRKLKNNLGDHLEHTLDIIHADNICHADDYCLPDQIPNIRKRLKDLDLPTEKIELPINGNDIIKRYNIKPSAKIGKLLDAVREEYFENPDITAEEAFEITDQLMEE